MMNLRRGWQRRQKLGLLGIPLILMFSKGLRLTKSNLKKILSYIEHGKREEATLLTGGKRVGNKGYYIEPTIFSNVKEDMLIAQDEIFGPMIALMKFKMMEKLKEM